MPDLLPPRHIKVAGYLNMYLGTLLMPLDYQARHNLSNRASGYECLGDAIIFC